MSIRFSTSAVSAAVRPAKSRAIKAPATNAWRSFIESMFSAPVLQLLDHLRQLLFALGQGIAQALAVDRGEFFTAPSAGGVELAGKIRQALNL
jgi:hypothetical protein